MTYYYVYDETGKIVLRTTDVDSLDANRGSLPYVSSEIKYDPREVKYEEGTGFYTPPPPEKTPTEIEIAEYQASIDHLNTLIEADRQIHFLDFLRLSETEQQAKKQEYSLNISNRDALQQLIDQLQGGQ